MAYIQIKGVNDYLLFILNDEVQEDDLLNELRQLLNSPSFKQSQYYPKAYFDFGKRDLTHLFFMKLMNVLDEAQKVIFCGLQPFKLPPRHLSYMHQTIRNGMIITQKEDCLFDGKINPGGQLICFGNVYLLGKCQGTIQLIGKNVTCSASSLEQATIQINQASLSGVTIHEMTIFYEKDGEILKQEGNLWQEQ